MTFQIAAWARRVAVVSAVGGMAVASVAAVRSADSVPGLTFKISASTKVYAGDTPGPQDDEIMRGRGIAVNDKSRIEFLAYTPLPGDLTTDDYLFGLDSGRVVVQHAASKEFTPANDMFNGPAVVALSRVMGGGNAGGGGRGGARPGRGGGGRGRGGRGARSVGQGFLNQIQLLNVKFAIEKLGAGEAIDGRPTQHYRITTDYRIIWGDEGLPAHAVTEVWSTPLPTKIPNPFEPLNVSDQSTDGPLIEYALKLRAIRAQIEGVPIKVVTTTTLTGIHGIVGFQSFVTDDPKVDNLTIIQQTQITGITPGDVDPKLVLVSENPEP